MHIHLHPLYSQLLAVPFLQLSLQLLEPMYRKAATGNTKLGNQQICINLIILTCSVKNHYTSLLAHLCKINDHEMCSKLKIFDSCSWKPSIIKLDLTMVSQYDLWIKYSTCLLRTFFQEIGRRSSINYCNQKLFHKLPWWKDNLSMRMRNLISRLVKQLHRIWSVTWKDNDWNALNNTWFENPFDPLQLWPPSTNGHLLNVSSYHSSSVSLLGNPLGSNIVHSGTLNFIGLT